MLSKAGMEIFLQEMVAQQPKGTINYQDINFLKLTTGQQTSHMVRKKFAKRIKSLEKTNGDNVVCETIRKINGFLENHRSYTDESRACISRCHNRTCV